MNCAEVSALAPIYFTGEMTGEQRAAFDAHLTECRACRTEIEEQASIDGRLRALAAAETPDSSILEQRVRRGIANAKARRRWMLARIAAAVVLVSLAAAYGLFLRASEKRMYVDAARDHQAEIVEGQPRHWRTSPADMARLAARDDLALAQLMAIAPRGYRLQRAKICGIMGEPMLHLVFTDGARSYSVYLRPDRGAKAAIRMVHHGIEEVAGLANGRFRVLVVTAGPAPDCGMLARLAATRL
jgi:anti-sigma factor RsiW